MTKSLALGGIMLVLLLASCAKQPSTTTQGAAPAPTGAAARTDGATAAADGARSGAGAGSQGSGGGQGGSLAGAARPSPKEFAAAADLADIHFDFDKADIREGDAKILDSNAVWLKTNANHLLLIEGHCDERGTNEYNTALGDRRAKATMNYLVSRGVQASRITVVSYGEERPVCAQHAAECWAKNRRAHFLIKPQ